MRRTIFTRIFAAMLLLSVLAVFFFSLYTFSAVREASFSGLTRDLERLAAVVSGVIEIRHGEMAGASLQADIVELGRRAGARLTVIDSTGTVRADSKQDPSTMENHGQRPEITGALEGRTGVSQRFSGTLGRWMVYVAVPMRGDAGVIGAVRASYPADLFARQVGALRAGTIQFALILFAACAAAALLLSRWLLTPLGQLTETVRRFTTGSFSARLHLRRRDEVRDLAESFNSMAERVQSLFGELSRRTQELDGVFFSVDQGIALLDKNGRIIRANRGFEDIVGRKDMDGKTLWEISNALPFMEIATKTRAKGPQPAEEVRIGDRRVICSVSRVAAGDNLIVVLQDTTDVRLAEEAKKDFVVNASHELRTPLTAIQGFLELIEAGVRGETARWVEIVRRNADRMSAIVEDMLRLSSLEAKDAELSLEKVNVPRILADVAGLFSAKARAKGIDLSVNAAPDTPELEADPFLLEQAVVNLVDNAIKYTESGRIDVACSAAGAGVAIVVEDTGIGIPEEHVSRIFERFYVVDKSRSRAMGGTGLGLSIVKHIVQLHGGSVSVESAVGRGTRFVLRLPLSSGKNVT